MVFISSSIIRTIAQYFCVSVVCLMGVIALGSALGNANAPSDQYTVTAETVTDNFTGLVWQRVAPNQNFTQASAIAFCNDLTLAGASDWRLPHMQELASIIDLTRRAPAIDSVAFPNTPSEDFWSATPLARDANQGWNIHFSDGLDDFRDKGQLKRARCVR